MVAGRSGGNGQARGKSRKTANQLKRREQKSGPNAEASVKV